MNLVRPSEASVKALRKSTEEHDAVLIYDEVTTSPRVALDDVQSSHGIRPDLTTVGKVVSGGIPLATFGDHKDAVEYISPLGSVYRAGTLSGSPITVAAGLKTLEIIQHKGFYENPTALTQCLVNGTTDVTKVHDVEFTANNVSGMFGLHSANHAPQNYADMVRSNIEGFKHFSHGVLDRNVVFGPSTCEAGLVSAAYTPELIDETIAVIHEVFKEMAK